MTFYAGMDTMMENTVLNVKNRSHTITAEVDVSEGESDGVIIAQGGRFAGWSLYVKDGAAKYCHNWFDTEYYYVGGEAKLPTGTVNIRYHFSFEGDAPGGGSAPAGGPCGGGGQGDAAARERGTDLGAEEAHALHVGSLPLHVGFAHVDRALEAEARRHGGEARVTDHFLTARGIEQAVPVRISEGGQGDPLTSAMPTWKETLDEQARWDVINYVQALGRGTVQPRHNMGGAAFDPAVEQQNRLEMLAEAMKADLIEQAEADTFDIVHTELDSLMAETGLRMQGNNLPALLTILVERAEVSQAQADTFAEVHDLLIEAGLMR